MEKLGVKKSGVLAVLLIVLFVTSVFSMTTNADKPVVIKIGVIATDDFLPYLIALYNGVVQTDINAYVAKLPADRFNPPVKFEFKVESMGPDLGTGKLTPTDESYAQVVKFHKEGVNLIIGGFVSSWIDTRTLSYLTKNNMVMISPTSNDPSLAQVDNLFRLFPDASYEGTIVAAMFTKLSLTTAIVLYRNDGFGSTVYNAFVSSLPSGVKVIPYPFAADDPASFQSNLALADSKSTLLSNAGVFLIAVDTDCAGELNRLPSDFATAYPNLAVMPWFGTDGTAPGSVVLTGTNLGVLKILSPAPAIPQNTKVDEMETRFATAMGYSPMDYGGACYIDAGWMLAQAVIETRPTWTGTTPGANEIIKVLIPDSSRYFGYSGWCQLDQYGDRVGGDWEIVGWRLSGGSLVNLQYGTYNYGTISWIITPTWP